MLQDIALTRSAHLADHEPAVEKARDQLEQDDVIRRIWNHDTTVWDPDAVHENESIRNRLGWLHSIETMADKVPHIKQFVEDVRADNLNQIVILGMGGSSLAAKFFIRTFGAPEKTGPQDGDKAHPFQMTVLDSTNPGAVLAYDKQIDARRVLFVVASKSGATVETLSFFRYFYNRLLNELEPAEVGKHFVAITDPDSPLVDLAGRHDFRATFLNDPHIGGRYAALSFFGLVPAALAGVDIDRLLDEAHKMARICEPDAPAEGNPAIWLGAILSELAKRGRDKLTLVTSPSLNHFGPWVEQLIAESTGKQGRGILPVVTEPTGLPRAYGDDRLFVYMQLASDHEEGEVSPTMKMMAALEEQGYPVVRMSLIDPYEIGGQLFLWMLATAIAGSRLGINPFDQPNVEAAKKRAHELVEQVRASGSLPQEQPNATFDDLQVYGDAVADTPGDCLRAFLDQAQPGDYVAIQAYLRPPFALLNVQRQKPETVAGLQETNEMHAALTSMCARIRDDYRLAATYGYGPRYLHSTGQLHKGDAGNGLFVQFTADHPEDASIPDQADVAGSDSALSFGQLQTAQAYGDLRALRDAKRRIIRFHLGRNPSAWLTVLNEALGMGNGYDSANLSVGEKGPDPSLLVPEQKGNEQQQTFNSINQESRRRETNASRSIRDGSSSSSGRDSSGDFSYYAPAYRFGYRLGSQEPYCRQTWQELHDAAKQEWEASHDRPWAEYVAIVRHAWNDIRNDFLDRLRNLTDQGDPEGSFQARFHKHFIDHYGIQNHSYRQYATAYHFGYDLAVDSRFRNQDWPEMEAEAERRWNQEGIDIFWDEAKPAIRFAWQEVRAEPLGWPQHASEFEGFGEAFYAHFRTRFADKGVPYADIAPAYHLGYDLAVEKAHHGMPWTEIEPLAQEEWSRQSAIPWKEAENAVRHAWQVMQEQLLPQGQIRQKADRHIVAGQEPPHLEAQA